MRTINLAYFMALGAALDAVNDLAFIASPNDGQWVNKANTAGQLLGALLAEGTVPFSIPASAPEIRGLIAGLNNFVNAQEGSRDQLAMDAWQRATKVKTLLDGELSIQAVYYVWPKRAYDTKRLVDNASLVFSPEVQFWFTAQETYDINQAGKCIAFEVPTAAGFHLLRAAESAIRRYVLTVTGTLPTPKMRSWGTYVRVLQKSGGDPKVVSAIEQVKELHRNPVMHPEEQLTVEQAVSLLGIIESLISAIFSDIAKRGFGGGFLPFLAPDQGADNGLEQAAQEVFDAH